ncbi:unnamed protein product [Rotaria socialis]|uniref:Uncharacterized protein n=6 Tax=Rotaria TaxID=231623 RepID=A0A820N0J2_9BILA|nr:unnamed protein product [Rotaria socialis]CAF4516999.1 unnamed protein product [Rotaria socialis]
METAGKYSNPQSLWRWDDVTNTLVHDRAVTAEKADINAETSSEKIDLWNLSPARRPMAYEKYPLEISKNKTTIAIEDIVHISLNMVSDTYYVPEKFAEFVKQFNHEETTRISNAECHMNTALVFVAQKYSNVVLGTGLKQYHHFYWIEGNDGDPLTKKREIIPYSGRVSRTLIDRGNAELLIIFATFVVWITFERKYFEVIREEIGRIIRTDAFPNPTYSSLQKAPLSFYLPNRKYIDVIFIAIQIRTRSSRSSRSTTSDFTTGGNGENASTYSDRKNTAASKKSTRSQKTVATASTTMSHTSSTSSKSGTKRQPFQRLLTQRSPIVVTLLPTARDQSAWLFDRVRGKSDQAAKLPKLLPENKFKIRYEIGVLGQPIDTLTLIASGKTPTGNTSASQLAQNDVKRRHSTVDSGMNMICYKDKEVTQAIQS